MSNHKKIDWFRWHQRKMWIRINCAILSAILLIVLLLMFPIVSDASTDIYISEVENDISNHLINQNGYEDFNPNYSDTFYLNVLTGSDYLNLDYLDGDLSNGEYKISFDSNDFGAYDTYPIRYIMNSNGTIQLHLWKPDNNSYPDVEFKLVSYHQGDSSNYSDINLCISSDGINFYSGAPSIGCHVIYTLSGDTFVKSQAIWNQNYITIDGSQYLNASLGSPLAINYCNTNLWSTNVNDFYSNGLEALSSTDLYDLNYYLADDPTGDNTYPDGSGGTDSNNLYLRTADWKFNIPQYWPSVTSTLVQPAYTNRWGEGSISFYGLLNDYQKDNASNFNLKFDFQIVCNGRYFSDTHSDAVGTFVGSFRYSNFTVPLSDFISNSNYVNFSVSNLFTECTNGLGQTFTSYLDNIKGHNSIDNWQWYILCDVCLVANGSESGHCKEKYDFISQVSKEIDYSITENTDPYYPDDYDPSKPNDSTSNEDGKIMLINNDNDSITINGNDKAVIDKLYDKLVPPDTVGEGGLTERFVNLTNANAWFEIMENQLSIFPAEFWTTVYTIFLASLGILGGAFLLWILAHIL